MGQAVGLSLAWVLHVQACTGKGRYGALGAMAGVSAGVQDLVRLSPCTDSCAGVFESQSANSVVWQVPVAASRLCRLFGWMPIGVQSTLIDVAAAALLGAYACLCSLQ
jgi:hypothetical protein